MMITSAFLIVYPSTKTTPQFINDIITYYMLLYYIYYWMAKMKGGIIIWILKLWVSFLSNRTHNHSENQFYRIALETYYAITDS